MSPNLNGFYNRITRISDFKSFFRKADPISMFYAHIFHVCPDNYINPVRGLKQNLILNANKYHSRLSRFHPNFQSLQQPWNEN